VATAIFFTITLIGASIKPIFYTSIEGSENFKKDAVLGYFNLVEL